MNSASDLIDNMQMPNRILVHDQNAALAALQASPGDVISIVGPTGSGKTRTALAIAKALGQERTLLVSVDSVALYRGLDIGSAKPLGDEREGFVWAGIDILTLREAATSSKFTDLVLPQMLAALSESRYVVVVGGSHFYERALLCGRAPGAASDPEFQRALEPLSNDNLYQRLLSADERFREKIHLADRYRITRYLDLCERQGLSFDELQSSQDVRPWRNIFTLATNPPEDLAQRTDLLRQRVRAMFDAGWLNEVQQLILAGEDPYGPGLQTIGYRDVVAHLQGEITYPEMFERIVIAHRQVAKVQRTWVRGLIKRAQPK